LGGGGYFIGDGINNQNNTDFWYDTGTFSLVAIYVKNTNKGIASCRINDVEKAVVDAYAAALSQNNVTTTAGITNSTAAAVNFKYQTATKNASSTGYDFEAQSWKWIRTGA